MRWAWWVVAVAQLGGCSTWIVPRHKSITQPMSCSAAYVAAPIADTGFAIGWSVLAGEAADDARKYQGDSPAGLGIPLYGALALEAAVSAAIGFYRVATCPGDSRAHDAWQREQDDAIARKLAIHANREEAWQLTQRAATLARSNDCTTVVSLGAQVAAVDDDFYRTVFSRDVAIATCLASTPAAPAP